MLQQMLAGQSRYKQSREAPSHHPHSHLSTNHNQTNLSSRERRHTPNRGVQSLDERLGFMARIPTQTQRNDVVSKPALGEPNLFRERMDGKLDPNKKSEQKAQKAVESTPIQSIEPKRQLFIPKQSKNQSESAFKTNNIFQKEKQNFAQIKFNVDVAEQSFRKSRFMPKNEQNHYPMPQNSHIPTNLNPQFQQLLHQFKNKNNYGRQSKSICSGFLQLQIQISTGNKPSPFYQLYDLHSLGHTQISEILAVKMEEIRLINHIFDAFLNFMAEKQRHQNVANTTRQIWQQLYNDYNLRTQEILTLFHMALHEPNRNLTCRDRSEEWGERVMTRMEELAQDRENESRWSNLKYEPSRKLQDSMIGNRQNKAQQPKYPVIYPRQSANLQTVFDPIRCKRTFIRLHKPSTQTQPKGSEQKLRSLKPFKLAESTMEEVNLQLRYSVFVHWFRTKQHQTADSTNQLKNLGSVSFTPLTTYEDLAQVLKTQISKKLHYTLRSNAEFQFSKIAKTQEPNIFEINITINQKIINISEEYSCQANWVGKFQVSKLVIQNQFGRAEWNQQINLLKVDFGREIFKIVNLAVECDCEELNKPCVVTFFDLPTHLKNDDCSKRSVKLFMKFIERERYAQLSDLSASESTFTVQFMNFNQKCRTIQREVQDGRKLQAE